MKAKVTIMSFVFVFLSSAAVFADLTVAVAANVQYTFEELKTAFEKKTGISVKAVIGSSGKFTAQIENGAPFDVFLSADMDYPITLYKEGLTVNAPKIYAYGALVIWTMTDVDLSGGIEVLADANVKKIAIASPKTAPYGRQAVNALKHYDLYAQVGKKLVYGESIAQANQFITTKAADVGITAKSVVLAPQLKDKGQWIDVPKESYEPIAQGVVILKHAERGKMDEANKLVDFISSSEAGEIFKKYGYALP